MTNRTRNSFAKKIRHVDEIIGLYKTNEIVAKEACNRIRTVLQREEIYEPTSYDLQIHNKHQRAIKNQLRE